MDGNHGISDLQNVKEEVRHVKEELENLKKDIYILKRSQSLTPVKETTGKDEIMETFHKVYIVICEGKRTKTVDVLSKMNKFAKEYGFNFSKFEVSKFMKQKGYVRTKIGSNNYYVNIGINEDGV